MHHLFALLLLLFTCASAQTLAAQHQDTTFAADVSKPKMLKNSTTAHQRTMTNAQGNELLPPKFDNCVVMRGPMRSLGTSIIMASVLVT